MPIINNLVYEPDIEGIKKEEQVIELLNDVKKSIALFYNVRSNSLEKVLKIVEQGVYESERNGKPSEPLVTYRVDLSKAQSLIQDYRRKSEGGCESCIDRKKFYENNETYKYCRIGENENSAKDFSNNNSPKINKFSEKGCKDRQPIFSKTIEQILKEAS